MNSFRRLRITVLGLMLLVGWCHATVFVWNGAVSGDWNTAGNWTNNAVPGTGGTDDVWLTASGFSPTNQNVAGLYANNLYFNTNAAGYVVNGSGIILKNVYAYSSGSATVTNVVNVPLTMAANNGWMVNNSPTVIMVLNASLGETGGSRSLSANGNGTIILAATNNTFTGGLHNNQSIICFTGDNNLGPAPATIVSNYFEGGWGTERITNTGAWKRVTLHTNRGWHVTGQQQLYLEGNQKVVINAPIYGTGFIKPSDGGGMLVLGGNNTNLTGGWQFNSGTTVLNHDMALGYGAPGSTISLWGTLDLNGHSQWSPRSIVFVNGAGDDAGGELRNNDTLHPATFAGGVCLGGGLNGGALQFGGNGDIVLPNTVSNSAGSGTAPYALQKAGNGTLTLQGANVFTNLTGIHSGGLTLDYTLQNNSKVGTNAALYLSQAVLKLIGNDSAATVQSIGNLYFSGQTGVNQGGANIVLQPGLNQDLTLAAQAIVVNGGVPLDISTVPNGSGTALLSTTNGNGILAGGAATWNRSSWAKVASGLVTSLADGEYATTFAGGLSNTHVDVQSGSNVLFSSFTEQTLRFNATDATTVVVSNGATLSLSGLNGEPAFLRPGILVTSNAGPVTIAGNGGLNPGLNQPLFIHQYSTNALTLAAQYGGLGSGNSLVKFGPGELIVTAANNTHNNNNFIYGGTLTVDNIKDAGVNCALGSGQNIFIGNAAFRYTGPAQAHNRHVYLRGPATLDASGSGPLTFTGTTNVSLWTDAKESQLTLAGTGSGVMGGALDLHAGSLIKDGTGCWTIGGTQPYTGNTIVTNGTLVLSNNCVLARSLSVGPAGTLAGSATIGEDLVMKGTRTVVLRSDADRDTLNVGYDVTLGGALSVSNAPGFSPTAKLYVPIVTSANGSVSGNFSGVTPGYTVTNLNGEVLLAYTPPPPAGTVIFLR